MNTKDNQEAELSGEAKFHIEVCRAMALINQSIGCVSDANGLEAKNILRLALYDYAPTTKQVNEEVASGKHQCFGRFDKNCSYLASCDKPCNKCGKVHTGNHIDRNQANYDFTTPSPSNVLVEALRDLVDMCVTQIGADYNDEIHRRYLKGKEALATYFKE